MLTAMNTTEYESRIAVAVGNTSTGIGVFSRVGDSPMPDPHPVLIQASPRLDWDAISARMSAGPAAWYVASVHRAAEQRLQHWVRVHRPSDAYRRLKHDDFPIRIQVDQPDRVGTDRLAGAVAANALRHAEHGAIIVDAGTAITVNAVSADGQFLGGAILPGRTMAAAALCSETDLLPLVETDNDQPPPSALGRCTSAAIRSGLYWGTVGAIRQLVRRLQQCIGGPTDLFLTGGGMAGLAREIDDRADFIPDLVLRGIALTATRLEGENRAPHA